MAIANPETKGQCADSHLGEVRPVAPNQGEGMGGGKACQSAAKRQPSFVVFSPFYSLFGMGFALI